MNDVPLVQKNDINSINTSLIAIKKQLKQINEAVGLIDIPNAPDLSPYVKKSDVVDVVESGNMNPVTSNAVVPVDEVASGNMHSVTSNAVANSMKWKLLGLREGQGNDSSFNVSIPSDSWDEVILVLKVSSQTHTQVFNRLFVSTYTSNLVEYDVLSKYTLLRANLIFSGTNYQQLTVNGIQFKWGGRNTTGIVGLYYR